MGRFLNLAVLVSATLSSAVLAAPTVADFELDVRGDCSYDNGGAHIIAARGTTEPPGMGALGQLAGMVQAGIPGTTAEGLDYPAVPYPSYTWSVNQGTLALTKQIEDYVARCPRARIVLLGYSQGAQVVMNTLCGTTENDFDSTPQLPRHLWKHIARVVVYADLSHLPNKRYDVGTAYTNGVFPRLYPKACHPFADRIRSYCDDGDVWCASGGDDSVHGGYFAKYDWEASQWLIRTTKRHMPWLHPHRHHRHHKHRKHH